MGKKPILRLPKSEAGFRTISIPPNVLKALTNHLDKFVAGDPEAWLFATSTGTAVSPRNFGRVWSTAREAAGRSDLHLHDLRHTGLTWAAATGATTKELMRRGGQSTPRAALIYQHATEDRDQFIAEALAKLEKKASVSSIKRKRAVG